MGKLEIYYTSTDSTQIVYSPPHGYLYEPFIELVDRNCYVDVSYEVLRELPLEDVEIETLYPNRSKTNHASKKWLLFNSSCRDWYG